MNRFPLSQHSRLLCFLFLLVLPVTGHAHSVGTGGEIASGMLHPLLNPSHVLILVGLGLVIGQHSPLDLETPVKISMPVSALALLLTTTGAIPNVYQPILASIALAAGIPVALEKALSPLVCNVFVGVGIFAIGLDSGVEGGSPLGTFKTLSMTWVTLNLVVFNLAFYVSAMTKKKWTKVGIRVLGSWLIAISLLVLAFYFKKHRSVGG